MLFQSLVSLVLALTATASPTIKTKRDLITAPTILSDIQSIDSSITALTASLQAYSGARYSETPIPIDITAIHLANRKSHLDANLRSPAFNASESTDIVEFTIKSVGVDILASVEVLKAKKALFRGQKALILVGVRLLKSDHESFSKALLGKLTADLERGEKVVRKIDGSLQSAVDVYSA